MLELLLISGGICVWLFAWNNHRITKRSDRLRAEIQRREAQRQRHISATHRSCRDPERTPCRMCGVCAMGLKPLDTGLQQRLGRVNRRSKNA